MLQKAQSPKGLKIYEVARQRDLRFYLDSAGMQLCWSTARHDLWKNRKDIAEIAGGLSAPSFSLVLKRTRDG